MANSTTNRRAKYLLVHPGAELFGSDRMFLESAKGLQETGARVIVVLPEPGPLADELSAADIRVVVARIFVLRKTLLRPRFWLYLIASALGGIVATVTLLRRYRPDVVYISTIIVPQWPVLSRLMRIPAVTHVHEAEVNSPKVIQGLLYAPHLLATALIINSQFTGGTIASVLPQLARKCTLVYNGVESPPPTQPRETLDRLRICYVGRLSPRKGPDLAIVALGILRERSIDADLTLVGSVFTGYEWYEARLRAMVHAAGLTSVVRFVGFTANIWPELQRCDVAVVPSRVPEPFGNAAVEALLAGRPVIAAKVGGLPEAADGYGSAQLIAPEDPTALADALAAVWEDWATFRREAILDRGRALTRHMPRTYRASVAEVVASCSS